MAVSQSAMALSGISLGHCSVWRSCTFGKPKIHSTTIVHCNYSVAPQKQNDLSKEDVETGKGGLSPFSIASVAVNALFSYEPFFKFAAGKARSMIIERGTEIGYPWAPEIAKLRLHDWDEEMKQIQNKYVEYPTYYLKPFHAYEHGNLSWDAAWEAELAARSVHANVFDPEEKRMDPDGDMRLRKSYHKKMLRMLKETPHAIVDIGCGPGLSTFSLHEVFPNALTVGVELSPYFISVANFRLKETLSPLEVVMKGKSKSVQFLHAAGEYTGLPSGVYDLVSICLVCHELPRSATKQVIEEAHRLLRRGGALSIMEVNPYSPLLQRVINNAFSLAAFKATEPYFDDYISFGIEKAIEERGFTYPTQAECSPRHRTIVALKK